MNASELRSFCTLSSGADSQDCQGTFNFKGSNMLFSSFVGHFSRTLYSLSVLGKRASRAASSSQDWDHEKGTCLDSFQWLPSVTFYLKVIYSVMPLLLRIWNAFWPFEDCYLLGFVFAQYFYCLKLPCMKIYKHVFLQIKHPCFTRDLGPLHPSSHWLQSPRPSLWRQWHGIKKAMFISDNRAQLQSRFQDVGQPRPGAVKELCL